MNAKTIKKIIKVIKDNVKIDTDKMIEEIFYDEEKKNAVIKSDK